MPISVAIVDDHAVIRDCLAAAVDAADDMECVARVSDPRDIVYLHSVIDVVILDLSLPGVETSIPEHVRTLHEEEIRVIAFTAGENKFLMRQAVRSGVEGMVFKAEPVNELINAVRTVANGDLAVNAHWADTIDSDPDFNPVTLSSSQLRVLELFAAGEGAKQVARELDLSVGTVNEYLERIKAKYAAAGRPFSARVALFRRAVEDGILPPP